MSGGASGHRRGAATRYFHATRHRGCHRATPANRQCGLPSLDWRYFGVLVGLAVRVGFPTGGAVGVGVLVVCVAVRVGVAVPLVRVAVPRGVLVDVARGVRVGVGIGAR